MSAFVVIGFVLFAAFFVGGMIKQTKDTDKSIANQVMRDTVNRTVEGTANWVKRGDVYEYSYDETLLVIRKRKSKKGFKIKGYYAGKMMFTGARINENNHYALYHWGDKHKEMYNEMLLSKELYRAVIKMIEREDKVEKEKLLRRLSGNRQLPSAFGSIKNHFDTLKEKEESNRPLASVVGSAKNHIEELKEKEDLKRTAVIKARENFKRKVQVLRGEVVTEQSSKNAAYLQQLAELNVAMERLLQQEESLTDEEKHLLTYTYPNDIEELITMYEELDEISKEEVQELLKDTLQKVTSNIEFIQQEVKRRKLKKIAVKSEVIKLRY